MTLDVPYFNFHDVALLLVIFQSVMLAILLLAIHTRSARSNHFLALFVLAVGLEAVDTLMYWCLPLKIAFFSDKPWVFFIFKGAGFLQGPLLYFYVRSTVYLDCPLSRRDLVHFIPIVAYPFYIALLFQQMGSDNLHAGALQYAIYADHTLFRLLVVVQPVVIIGYSIMALRLLIEHKKGLKDHFSNLENVERNWLKILTIGFLIVCSWNFLVYIFDFFVWSDLASASGLVGNYFDFIFINCLVFYSLVYSSVLKSRRIRNVETVADSEPGQHPEGGSCEEREPSGCALKFRSEDIQALTAAIKKDKLYLVPDLTLDQLAKRAGLSPRTASQIINRHFKMCFFDFINSHRVAEAKMLLAKHPEMNILELSELAGFNSKSSFNRFFRKYAEMTPTEYRRQNV